MWHVMVYSGLAEERRKRCKGTFSDRPTALDVHRLLKVVSPLKKRQVVRRTPESEPEPASQPVGIIIFPRGPLSHISLVDVQI
jgi:hypothetical protein